MINVKKKRTISIKDFRIRKLRDSLRYILSEALISETGKLVREKAKTDIDDRSRPILADKIDKLNTSWKKSICVCPVCGSRTSDMTFNPYDEYWYCTKCYEENHEFYKKRGETYIFP